MSDAELLAARFAGAASRNGRGGWGCPERIVVQIYEYLPATQANVALVK